MVLLSRASSPAAGAPRYHLASSATGTSGTAPLAPSPTSRVVDLGPTYQAGNGNLVDFWGIGVALAVILGVIAVVRWAFRGGAVSEARRDDGGRREGGRRGPAPAGDTPEGEKERPGGASKGSPPDESIPAP